MKARFKLAGAVASRLLAQCCVAGLGARCEPVAVSNSRWSSRTRLPGGDLDQGAEFGGQRTPEQARYDLKFAQVDESLSSGAISSCDALR